MKKPLSLPQIVALALLWLTLCYLILTTTPQLDGPLLLSLVISGVLVFLPLLKYLRSSRK